jgi:hypothetical protein
LAGRPLFTVTEEDDPPSTVSETAAAGVPVPVSGMTRGELGSELVMVRLPERTPAAAGVNVMVMAQLAPAPSEVAEQGFVMA